MSRLPGHALIGEGAPHREDGVRILRAWGGTFGVGHGKCSCGALSEELTSSTKRKAWHREHKDAIRSAK